MGVRGLPPHEWGCIRDFKGAGGEAEEEEEVGWDDPGGEVGCADRVGEDDGRIGGDVEQLRGEEVDEGEEGCGKGGEKEMDEKCDEECEEGGAYEKGEEEIVEEAEEGELMKMGEDEGKDCEIDS